MQLESTEVHTASRTSLNAVFSRGYNVPFKESDFKVLTMTIKKVLASILLNIQWHDTTYKHIYKNLLHL